MSLTKEQIASVKGRGFLLNRGTENFSGRVVAMGGVFTSEQLIVLSECARKYGNGKIVFTSRQDPEIVGIRFDNIPAAEAFLNENGMMFGGTGAKIRPVTACKGTTCTFGNIDTQGIAKILHERFYVGMHDAALPHKFKIGVGGCPNSCVKPSLNDIGVEGCRPFEFDDSKCRSCGKCAVASACPSKAPKAGTGKTVLDKNVCLSCGVCIGKCPFGAVPAQAEPRCRIYVGGTWGRSQRIGTKLDITFTPEEIPDVVERAILWYKENGLKKERFGKTIDRVGMESLKDALKSDEIQKRKDAILAAPVREN